MNITVIGTGYVGLVTGAIFAHLGNDVFCVDTDEKKIVNLKKGISPIYEPGLEKLINQNIKENRLQFTTDIKKGIKDAEAIFIAVGTPSRNDGSVNLGYVSQAAIDIGKALAKIPTSEKIYRVIVNKSTVPIGTGDMVANIIKEHYSGKFDVVSNPEFLREGQAVSDCLSPDRIVIGNSSGKSRDVMEKLYSDFTCPKLFTDIKTAEMIKYASNSYLATSISFINSIAELCEQVGSDVSMVSQGMRLDKRIGKNAFLDAGPGYGGSCFPKDVKGLIDIAHQNNVIMPILEATEEVNIQAKHRIINKMNQLIGSPAGKIVTVWGLAFKANTDDVRDAPVLPVLDYLTNKKSQVVAFDPVAKENIKKIYPSIKFAKDPYESVKDADLIVVMTEWDELRKLDLVKVKKLMKTPNMVDGRNIYGIEKMQDLGYNYVNIGKVK